MRWITSLFLPLLSLPAVAQPWLTKLEKASNGHIEVVHARIQLETGKSPHIRVKQLAAKLFKEQPKLHEIDVSGYAGGNTPRFTLSLPRSQWPSYQKNPHHYPRQWSGQVTSAKETEVIEKAMVYNGNPHTAEAGLSRQDVSRLVFRGPQVEYAALTFDDSPHPMYEPLLLDTLARSGVRATFFCIGRNAEMYPYFVTDMARQGHEVANHTYHHLRLPHLTGKQMKAELESTNRLLHKLSGVPVRFFRPPGGEYTDQVLEIASQLKLITAFWTDDPGDFANPGESAIEKRLLHYLKPGAIILLHDNAPQTLKVLPKFLKVSRKEGFQLGTMTNLMKAH